MRILNYALFLEKNLDLQELSKDTPEGGKRGDRLVSKIKSHDPISTTDGEIIVDNDEEVIDGITDDDGDYDPDSAKTFLKKGIRYKEVFDFEDDHYKLSDLQKTADFGSSGAGRTTRQFESIQCLAIAVRQMFDHPIKMADLYNNIDIDGLYIPFDVTRETLDQFKPNKDWVHTFCSVPNKLFKKIDSNRYLNFNIKYDIYHIGYNGIDSPCKVISSKFLEFSRNNNSKININKFCPSDTYMISRDNKDLILLDIRNTESMNDLINVMNYYFDTRELVSISLKKTKSKVFPKIITNNEANRPIIEFTFDNVMVSRDPLLGIASKITATSKWKKVNKKEMKMTFDSPNASKLQNIDGEVDGSASRHGRINLGEIMRIISKVAVNYDNFPEIEHASDLVDRDLDVEIEDLYNLVVDELRSQGKPVRCIGGRELDNDGKKISKLQSLQLVYCLLNLTQEDADYVVTKMFKYALAIETNDFITPKYLRVI